jgi:hypothetical protein
MNAGSSFSTLCFVIKIVEDRRVFGYKHIGNMENWQNGKMAKRQIGEMTKCE